MTIQGLENICKQGRGRAAAAGEAGVRVRKEGPCERQGGSSGGSRGEGQTLHGLENICERGQRQGGSSSLAGGRA